MIAALVVAAILTQDGLPETQDGLPEIPAILRRDPAQLPRAAAGRWDGWPDAVQVDPQAGKLVRALQAAPFVDIPRTLTHLYQALEREPDFPAALVVLGLSYFRLQRYGDAVLVYERLLEVVPRQLERTHALGHSYYSLGDYARAREHYRRILRLVPSSPEALRGQALSALRLGDEETALELLGAALRIAPGDFESHLWTARIREGRGEAEAARESVARGRELRAFDPRIWYVEMQALYALGRDAEAAAAEERWRELDRVAQELRRLEAILRIHPERFGLVARSVELQRTLGDTAAVRLALERLERVRPDGVALVELRVYALDVLWSLQDQEGAALAARALARDCPQELAAWRRLELHYGLTKERLRQIEAARRVRELESGAGGA